MFSRNIDYLSRQKRNVAYKFQKVRSFTAFCYYYFYYCYYFIIIVTFIVEWTRTIFQIIAHYGRRLWFWSSVSNNNKVKKSSELIKLNVDHWSSIAENLKRYFSLRYIAHSFLLFYDLNFIHKNSLLFIKIP